MEYTEIRSKGNCSLIYIYLVIANLVTGNSIILFQFQFDVLLSTRRKKLDSFQKVWNIFIWRVLVSIKRILVRASGQIVITVSCSHSGTFLLGKFINKHINANNLEILYCNSYRLIHTMLRCFFIAHFFMRKIPIINSI